MSAATAMAAMSSADPQLGDWALRRQICEERDARRLVYEVERPPAGTACRLCALKGGELAAHFCPAKGYLRSAVPGPDDPIEDFEEYPVCAACGLGEPCGHAVAIEKLHAPVDEEMFAPEAGHDPGHQVEVGEVSQAAAVGLEDNPWSKVKATLSVDNLRTTGSRGMKGRVPTRRIVLPVDGVQCSCGRPLRSDSQGGRCHICRRAEQQLQRKAAKEADLAARQCSNGCGRTLRKGTGVCVRCRPKVEAAKRLEAKQVVREDKTMARQKTQISDELRAKIAAYPAEVPTDRIRKELHVSWALVAGLRGAQKTHKAGRRPKVESKKTAAARAIEVVERMAAPQMVDLRIPAAALDLLWAGIPVPRKAELIERAFADSLATV